MAGIINVVVDGIQRGVHTAANHARNATLSSQEIQNREKLKLSIQLQKGILLVVSAVAFFFFALFPSLFTFGIAGLTAYACFETNNFLSNVREVLDNAILEARVRSSRKSLITQLTKNAPLSRFILERVL